VCKASSDYVFTREDGEPIRDFRDSWTNVCKEAGVPELLFHDLRRTGVRNMIRSGIPQKVAMRISGHKTPSVFNRYDIIDQTDLQDAARKMEAAEEVRTRTSIVAPPLRVVAGRAVQ
jgi:integrase